MNRRAFTLVELLVSVSIVILLVALITTLAPRAIARAHIQTCISNLKQVGKAVELYAADFDDHFPHIVANGQPAAPGEDFAIIRWQRVLQPYGVTQALLMCPSQNKGRSDVSTFAPFHPLWFSSYMHTDLFAGMSRVSGFARSAFAQPIPYFNDVPWLPEPGKTTLVGPHDGHGTTLYTDGRVEFSGNTAIGRELVGK